MKDRLSLFIMVDANGVITISKAPLVAMRPAVRSTPFESRTPSPE